MGVFLPIYLVNALSSTPSSMSGILTTATEVLTWLITSMTSVLTFITSNPVVLVVFMVFLSGAAVGMLMRIWKSV